MAGVTGPVTNPVGGLGHAGTRLVRHARAPGRIWPRLGPAGAGGCLVRRAAEAAETEGANFDPLKRGPPGENIPHLAGADIRPSLSDLGRQSSRVHAERGPGHGEDQGSLAARRRSANATPTDVRRKSLRERAVPVLEWSKPCSESSVGGGGGYCILCLVAGGVFAKLPRAEPGGRRWCRIGASKRERGPDAARACPGIQHRPPTLGPRYRLKPLVPIRRLRQLLGCLP